jgi:acetyl esterase/lipase
VFAFGVMGACRDPLPVHTDVRYDERFGEDTAMDVYVAEGADPHPTVMLIHGGAWIGGSKDEYTEAAKRLARSGYTAATINYRLAPEGEYPKIAQDCLCALSYLQKNAAQYHIDPDRIAVMGYSAGGHLASLVGVAWDDPFHAPDCAWGTPAPPRAVIANSGVHDLRGKDNFITETLFGAGPDEVPDKYAHASPMTHIGPGNPPFLFIHGTIDWWIDEDEADAMRDALVAAGNEARLYEVNGGGHITQTTLDGQFIGGEADLTTEAWIAVMDFLDRHLAKRTP